LALGLWATSCHSMVVRAFIARKDTITPTLIGLCSLFINVAASLLLMGRIPTRGEGLSDAVAQLQHWLLSIVPWHAALGHVGLALASSTAAFASLCIILAIFNHRLGGFPWKIFLSSFVRAAGASLCMVAALLWLTALGWSAVTTVATGLLIGPCVYLAASTLFRSEELQETGRLVLAKILK
jgi:peptidoglycan biosynthesis protein MviN/MurJ (putative lipid II flippase)